MSADSIVIAEDAGRPLIAASPALFVATGESSVHGKRSIFSVGPG